jgi:hypothetical protein
LASKFGNEPGAELGVAPFVEEQKSIGGGAL